MKEFTGKECNILISINNSNLFYKAVIYEITDTHITFKDKFGRFYSYSLDLLCSISEN
jgi:hypothetical protein